MNNQAHIEQYLKARPDRAGFLLKKYAGNDTVSRENIINASDDLDFVKELYLDHVEENEIRKTQSFTWEQFKEWFNTGSGLINETNQLLNPDRESDKSKEEIEKRNNNMMWFGFLAISISTTLVLFALLKK